MPRIATAIGDLVRRGFMDATRTSERAAALDALVGEDAPAWFAEGRWLDLMSGVSDPDQAVALLVDLGTRDPQCLRQVLGDESWMRRLLAVLGGSQALGQHLAHHPGDVDVLAESPRRWQASEIADDVRHRTLGGDADDRSVAVAGDRLRLANKRHLCRIAARDLTCDDPAEIVAEVAGELADLADGVVRAGLQVVSEATPGAERTRLAVIALGKCGARELNYISDVDVLFVAEPATGEVGSDEAIRIAATIASALTRLCAAHTGAGSIWQLDAALRPEGKAGALVRSLASMRAYYDKWASNWEFQAMLKARPMAGDLELGQAFVDLVAPKVWSAAERPHFLAESQAMRQRVIAHLPAKEADREIKLSAGGLRDTEFTVQLLQLVHGRADDRIRTTATLDSLQALVDHGYIGRADGAELAAAYRFQRVLEHRVQVFRMRRSHLLPDDEPGLRRIARGLGMREGAEQVTKRWRSSARKVQRLHQRIFYSPLLEAVTKIRTDELALSADAARDRLRFLGFADPDAATRHIKAVTSGSTRSSEIQRQLMPAMLGWLAEAPSPDAGLLAFRQVSEALRDSPWFLRALRDEGQMAHRLGLLLSSSRYAVDLLKRSPDAMQLLGDDAELVPRHLDDLLGSVNRVVTRNPDPDEAGRALRALRRRELFRIAAADLLGLADLEAVGHGLSDLTSATIQGALDIVQASLPDAPQLGVLAMGRWGGAEMSYGSDADAVFVIADSDDPQAVSRAGQVVSKVRALLGAPGPDPRLEVDADLRPEGKGGPMVRTVSSTKAYYDRWADTWEAQALVRARFGAGDAAAVEDVLTHVQGLRHPAEGLSRTQLTDIRKLKARMETERLPRGTDPKRNLKLGPGGLSDVEWTVQVLQLQHAHEIEGLRTTGTLPALLAARQAGLLDAEQASRLEEAWTLASRVRNAIVLAKGRPSDVIPHAADDLAAIAHLVDHDVSHASALVERWARASRRAAQVVDQLFWGRGQAGSTSS